MPTLNPRINITIPEELAAALSKIAKHSKKSVSKVAFELIEWAIEEREDLHFSKIADERVRSHPKFVSDSEAIWE
jgi:predicted DNA-binding protein